MAEKKDYYDILGVSKSATDAEIKSAFRKLAKKYHPDVSKEADAEKKFKEAQEAYGVLSDKSKREQYDQYGHSAFQGGAGGQGFQGFNPNDFDFGDIFGDIFGSSFGFGSSRNSNRPRKGPDTILRMNLTFEEAVFGTTKTIKLDTYETCDNCDGLGGHGEQTCETCHGSGQVAREQRTILGTYVTRSTCPECNGKGKTYKETCKVCKGTGRREVTKNIEVKIPAGVDTGNQLRIPNKGEAGSNGGPNGDVYLEFLVAKSNLYKRDGEDIYLDVPITITDAVLGTKLDIPTLYGNIKLNIPAGTQSGDVHRLKGKGIEDINSSRKGNMYVTIKVVTPRKLDRKQKDLFQALEKTNLEEDEIKKYKSKTR